MKALRSYLSVALAVWSVGAFAQNCFTNCSGRLNKSVDTLTADQMRERLKSADFLTNHLKILNELIGCSFPPAALKTPDGKSLSIRDFKGKPVFVTFWFTSCPPCIRDIPVINKLAKEYGSSAVFLSVNTDDAETLNEFLKSQPYNSTHVIISREQAYQEFCTICGFPSNLVLDKNGKVTDVWSGGIKEDDFYTRIKKGLDEALKK